MNSPTKFTPKTATPRPPLPSHAFNPLIASMDKTDPAPVKFQVITREGQDIVVGRVKIPTPNGNHAFILRRFDTGAISLSTMFRASFPTAGDEAEKIDSNWVKANFDLTGANGGGKLRLAGTWVPPALAVHLAPSYSLGQVVFPLAEAQPDAGASYRKSSRHTTNGPVTANANALSSPLKTNRVPPTIPESPSSVPPTKRTRRESASPAQARIITPSSPLKQAVLPATVEVQETQETPEAEAEPEVPGPDMEEDLAESKALIERLKREKAEAEAKNQELAKVLNEAGVDEAIQATSGAKRGREVTPPLTMNFDRQPENTERQLVRSRSAQQANRRSAMWGAVAFAVGLGVTSVIPNLFF